MNIYRIEWYDLWRGNCLAWAGSAKQASDKIVELREQYDGKEDKPEFTATEIDFPTTKAELVSWLNTYVQGDNG